MIEIYNILGQLFMTFRDSRVEIKDESILQLDIAMDSPVIIISHGLTELDRLKTKYNIATPKKKRALIMRASTELALISISSTQKQ